MRTLLLFSLLLTSLPHGLVAVVTQEDSLVLVLNFKYSRSRQAIKKLNATTIAPAPDMAEAKKIAQRNPRPQGIVGAPDPNTQTIDARSAALEKNVQESLSPSITHVDGYLYQTTIRNAHTQNIEIVYWEYQFKESVESGECGTQTISLRREDKAGQRERIAGLQCAGRGRCGQCG